MKKKLFFIGAVLSALLISPGCGHSKKIRLTPYVSHVRAQGERDLHVEITRCTGEISVREVGVDLTEKGLVMVAVCMQNRGGDRYVFRPSYSAIARVSHDQLAPYLYYDTPTRCIWLSLPSLLLWWPAVPLVVVPCGLMWSQSNQQLERYVTQKLIGPETSFKIEPYETLEKFFFVPEEAWVNTVTLGFFDKNTDELVRFTADFWDR